MAGYPRQLLIAAGNASLDVTRVVACLAEPAPAGGPVATDAVLARLAAAGFTIEGERANHGPELIWLRARKNPKGDARKLEKILGRTLAWVGPVYRLREASGQPPAISHPPPTPRREDELLFCPRPDTLLLRARPQHGKRMERAISRQRLVEDGDKSAWLGGWRYLRLPRPRARHALDVFTDLRRESSWLETDLECVPFLRPYAAIPDDPYFGQQWNMTRIGAPAAWDVTTGDRRVVVAVLDSGCDLDHADLAHAYVSRGTNAGDMTLDGSPIVAAASGRAVWHGTGVAGVVAAAMNNRLGVAGLAAGCGLLPVAIPTGSTVENAIAIRYAAGAGARILNLSWSIGSHWFESHVRDAIDFAVGMGCLVCASAGNGDAAELVLPAGYAPVMACGGSAEDDTRWRRPEHGLGSHYGDEIRYGAPTGVSVVAPATNIPTTDIAGPEGFFTAASPAGDYVVGSPEVGIPAPFGATSASVPHVAGAAALLLSAHRRLDAASVRSLLERTAEKVGGYAYADVAGYPSGSRHPEMGYGRLNVERAIDLGDVMIADWSGDDGIEPSAPPGGNFWTYSDIVLAPESGDGVFDPASPERSSIVVPGERHIVTVRVRNRGPVAARDVRVEVRATPWVGIEFTYPRDWRREDSLHVRAAPIDGPIAVLPAGEERLLRFSLTATEIDALAGWAAMPWHPCLLAVATAANDHAFASSPGGPALQTRRNNLAQRNLTVAEAAGRTLSLPFVVGHPDDKTLRFELCVDAGRAALDGELHLVVDDEGTAFPALRAARGFARGGLEIVGVKGGRSERLGNRRAVRQLAPRMVVELRAKRPGRRPLHLMFRPPARAPAGAMFLIAVAQRPMLGGVVGGATMLVRT